MKPILIFQCSLDKMDVDDAKFQTVVRKIWRQDTEKKIALRTQPDSWEWKACGYIQRHQRMPEEDIQVSGRRESVVGILFAKLTLALRIHAMGSWDRWRLMERIFCRRKFSIESSFCTILSGRMDGDIMHFGMNRIQIWHPREQQIVVPGLCAFSSCGPREHNVRINH